MMSSYLKSPGSDKLHSRVLKELADILSEPLSVTSENTWRVGEVPETRYEEM